MSDTRLELEQKVGIGELERFLASHRRLLNQRTRPLRIDLRKVEWIGQPAACQLIAVLASIRQDAPKREVILCRSGDSPWPPQPRKSLIDSGLVDLARTLGVKVDFSSPRSRFRGLAATHLNERSNVAELVEESVLGDATLARARARIEQLARQALPELAENSSIHSGSSIPCWIVVGIAEAVGGDRERRGLLTPFSAGTTYVEATISDLGIGIVESLQAAVPKGRRGRVDRDGGLSAAEQVLAVSLDPYSTRDVEARAHRIAQLLSSDSDIRASSITTGLFQVLELCRQSAGELILRTSSAILLLRYRNAHDVFPEVENGRALGIRTPFAIRGTHITVRIPLLTRYKVAEPTQTTWSKDQHVPRVYSAPELLDDSLTEAQFIGHALDSLNAFAASLTSADALLITATGTRLSARGRSLFAHSLKSVFGPSVVIWDEPAAAPSAQALDAASGSLVSSQNVLVGDLSSNAFVALQPTAPPSDLAIAVDSGDLKLNPKLVGAFLTGRARSVQALLNSRIRSPSILKRGRFALQRYYTAEFFEIAELTNSALVSDTLAEWFIEALPATISERVNLICFAQPMMPVAEKIQELLAMRRAVEVRLVEPPTGSIPWQYVSELLSLHREPTIIVTDVVVSGSSLAQTVSLLADHPLVALLTVVDARDVSEGTPLQIKEAGARSQSVVVISVARHALIQYQASDLVPTVQSASTPPLAELDEQESVAVVDLATHRPTVFSRPKHRPFVALQSLADGRLLASRAVVARHVSHRDKHYGYYLLLPALFSELRRELKEWFDKVAERDRKESLGPLPWRVLIHDPEDAFAGLRDLLSKFEMDKAPEHLKPEDLAAPPSFAAIDCEPYRVLLVLSAVSSGSVLRMAVEYASRGRPKSIVVVAGFSRMPLAEFAFMSNIRRYRDAQIHFERFVDFPVDTYAPGAARCPFCAMEAEWDRLARTVRDVPDAAPLLAIIDQKRKSLRAVSVDVARDAADSLAATPADIIRTRTRALISTLRTAKPASGGEKEADELLQTLAGEAIAFSADRLQALLGDSFYVQIRERLRYLMEAAMPPYAIGRVVGAAELLGPALLIDNAESLLRRFGADARDCEEICLALLRVRAKPRAIRSASLLLRQRMLSDAASLVEATSAALGCLNADQADGSNMSVLKVLAGLAVAFQRTHMFHNLCESLPAYAAVGSGRTWTELRGDVLAIADAWDGDVALRLERLRENYGWHQLQRVHPHLLRAGDFEAALADLQRTARLEPGARDSERSLRESLANRANRLLELSLAAHREIEALYCAPAQVPPLDVEETLTAESGAKVAVDTSAVDRKVGEAFIPRPVLEQVVAEMLQNLKKHAPDLPSMQCKLSMHQDEHHIVIQFADNFGGRFDMSSPRGLAMIQENVRNHCGEVESTEVDATGWKSLILRICRPYGGPV